MSVDTRYLRSDTHTINTVLGYKLLTANTAVTSVFTTYKDDPNEFTPFVQSTVKVINAAGGSTTIGTNIASTSSPSLVYVEINATWGAPLTALNSTDAIQIDSQIRIDSNITTRIFITNQLGSTSLDAVTWTFYYWIRRRQSGSDNWADHQHGDVSFNSRITNFSHSAGIPPGGTAGSMMMLGIGR